jgi:hypothetical protein
MNLQTNHDLALNKPKDVKQAITTWRDMQTLWLFSAIAVLWFVIDKGNPRNY